MVSSSEVLGGGFEAFGKPEPAGRIDYVVDGLQD
jgi:hypothetical protein